MLRRMAPSNNVEDRRGQEKFSSPKGDMQDGSINPEWLDRQVNKYTATIPDFIPAQHAPSRSLEAERTRIQSVVREVFTKEFNR